MLKNSQVRQFVKFLFSSTSRKHVRDLSRPEKEPLTLEKDKEDQSKYYLSYPKTPVLDMKWENRDIKVAE